MNIEHRTSNSPKASKHLSASGGSNVEWEKMKKQTYNNDILQETEELIKIFVTSIKTAVRQAHGPERSRRAEKKQK
ncbi:MAG: hypothetical protein JRJ11_13515 [Deltaproteobacteria bacterium]|nr:hypothetical protein [Deltaproteobacteria bacterium]